MKDGLYIVDRGNIYGAFVLHNGEVRQCAPILRKNIGFYKTVAQYVETERKSFIYRPDALQDGGQQHEAAQPPSHDLSSQEQEHVPQEEFPPPWRQGIL